MHPDRTEISTKTQNKWPAELWFIKKKEQNKLQTLSGLPGHESQAGQGRGFTTCIYCRDVVFKNAGRSPASNTVPYRGKNKKTAPKPGRPYSIHNHSIRHYFLIRMMTLFHFLLIDFPYIQSFPGMIDIPQDKGNKK